MDAFLFWFFTPKKWLIMWVQFEGLKSFDKTDVAMSQNKKKSPWFSHPTTMVSTIPSACPTFATKKVAEDAILYFIIGDFDIKLLTSMFS